MPLSLRRLLAGRAGGALVAAATLAAVAGCAKTSRHEEPPPPAAVDAWRHRPGAGTAVEPGALVELQPAAGLFTLVEDGAAPPLVVSGADWAGVQRVVDDLQSDIQKVTGVQPVVAHDAAPAGAAEIVLVGTLGKSALLDALVTSGKLDVSDLAGRWETFVIQAVDAPMAGVSRALVIAGSDQRGTIYGAYEVSRRIGVSPWSYWDDVPVVHRDALYLHPERYTLGTPAVKYRGIFINDENPQLGNWVPATFGNGLAPGFPYGFNHQYYAKVFETMLRLRANYLWPAVWGRAFAEDDPENHATATRYGIVMGTSHEAPMMRGIEEWNRHPRAYGGNGEWRFSTNRDAVVAYMRDGIVRMKEQGIEGVVTLGMRGPGDVALPPEDGVPLLQDLVGVQRQILQDVMGGDIRDIPQVWTLYSEVLDWYLGPDPLQVPDDVTVVWAEDNWGNFKKLPAQYPYVERAGGYGLYYHLDFVGGPRCYKWVDSTLLENAWEQLNLAYTYGVDRVWMVNVGDLKNVEVPTEFFLDYAWAPERWPVARIPEWQEQWAAQQFGPEHAPAIAAVVRRYQALQSDRKPELLNRVVTLDQGTAAVTAVDGDPFSLVNYAEHERVTGQWVELAADAQAIADELPAASQDAWFELVNYAVQATANAYRLRLAQFQNLASAAQGRAATNDLAVLANARFADDTALNTRFNTQIAGGKWTGWATQAHFGYGKVLLLAAAGEQRPVDPGLHLAGPPDHHRPGRSGHGRGRRRLRPVVAARDGHPAGAAHLRALPVAARAVDRGVQPRQHRLHLHGHRGRGVRRVRDRHARERDGRPRGPAAGPGERRGGAGRADLGAHHRDRQRGDHGGGHRAGGRLHRRRADLRVRGGERVRVHRGGPLRRRHRGRPGELVPHPGHRPDRRRHDGAAPRRRRGRRAGRELAAPRLPHLPVRDRDADRGRVDVPLAAQQRPDHQRGPGRPLLRRLHRRGGAAGGERLGAPPHRPAGQPRARQQPVGVEGRQPGDRGPHHPLRDRRRPAHAPVLARGPHRHRAEAGGGHRRPEAQPARAAGEPLRGHGLPRVMAPPRARRRSRNRRR
jgi:hypothetical protein